MESFQPCFSAFVFCGPEALHVMRHNASMAVINVLSFMVMYFMNVPAAGRVPERFGFTCLL